MACDRGSTGAFLQECLSLREPRGTSLGSGLSFTTPSANPASCNWAKTIAATLQDFTAVTGLITFVFLMHCWGQTLRAGLACFVIRIGWSNVQPGWFCQGPRQVQARSGHFQVRSKPERGAGKVQASKQGPSGSKPKLEQGLHEWVGLGRSEQGSIRSKQD